MTSRLVSLLYVCFCGAAVAAVEVPPQELPSTNGPAPLAAEFRASSLVALSSRIELTRPKALNSSAPQKPSQGRLQIGWSGKDALKKLSITGRTLQWEKVAGGHVGAIRVRSADAAAIRVGLKFERFPLGLEVTVAGSNDHLAQRKPTRLPRDLVALSWREAGTVVWTPVTSGEWQQIELWLPASNSEDIPNVSVDDVSHLILDPFSGAESASEKSTSPKLLSCHENYSCLPSGELATAGKAVAKLVITTSEGSFVCSGSLLTDRAATGTPYFATAHHCGVTAPNVAAAVQFIWHYEQQCGGLAQNPARATTIGASTLYTDRINDFTLLRLVGPLPGGLMLLGWDPRELSIGTPVAGIHHPDGSSKKYSLGNYVDSATISAGTGGDVQTVPSSLIAWQRGRTEGGSSGSPLLTQAGHFVGTLFAGPANQTCSSPNYSFYSQFSRTYARAKAWLDPSTPASDDWANSASETLSRQSVAFDTTAQVGFLNSPTDQDWFRFNFSQPGLWLAYTDYVGSASETDTVGRIYSSDGRTLLDENDDDPLGYGGFNFAFYNEVLSPGTYFVQVTGYRGAVGPYAMYSMFLPKDDHSDLLFLGTRLNLSGSITGSLSREGDLDAFAIDVPSSGSLTLSSSANVDLMAALYDSSGNLVAFNDDVSYPTNLNFWINRSVIAGRYYLGVVGYDPTSRGPYSIAASFSPAGAPATSRTAVEFYHAGFGHYFVTDIPAEIAAIESGAFVGWSRTGQTFKVFGLNAAGASNVCRFFSTSFSPRSSHFYTASSAECSSVKTNQNWEFEGEVFALKIPDGSGACPSATVPLYRLYNNGRSGAPNHRYTTSTAIRSQMIGQGWIPEGLGSLGVIGCVAN